MSSNIDYFKQQAKNLQKDFESRKLDEKTKQFIFTPKFFDIEKIFTDFNLPWQNSDFEFPLMKAQHTVSKIAGSSSWNDLIHLSEPELETSKNIFSNSKYKLQKLNSETQKNKSEAKILPAPKDFYVFILPQFDGIHFEFTFSPVEYAQKYMIYRSEKPDISTAQPFAEGSFSPIRHVDRMRHNFVPYYWVRAFDGKNYGEWSTVAIKNR